MNLLGPSQPARQTRQPSPSSRYPVHPGTLGELWLERVGTGSGGREGALSTGSCYKVVEAVVGGTWCPASNSF